MADEHALQVTLPADAAIFGDLVSFAGELAKRGEIARVIGGVAVTAWGIALQEPRGVATNDIDAVVPPRATADEASLRTYARHLHAATAGAGYFPPKNPQPAERFAFLRAAADGGEPRKIELTSAESTLGRLSKRPPPVRHLLEDEDGLKLTVAVNPWLDLAPEPWTLVVSTHREAKANFEIPSCPALYLLKVKAVRDKQVRVAAEKNEKRRDHEIARLARHLDDLRLIKDWIESRGELPDLRRIAGDDPRVRQATNDAELWFLEITKDIAASVFERAPRIGRGQAGIRALLEF